MDWEKLQSKLDRAIEVMDPTDPRQAAVLAQIAQADALQAMAGVAYGIADGVCDVETGETLVTAIMHFTEMLKERLDSSGHGQYN